MMLLFHKLVALIILAILVQADKPPPESSNNMSDDMLNSMRVREQAKGLVCQAVKSTMGDYCIQTDDDSNQTDSEKNKISKASSNKADQEKRLFLTSRPVVFPKCLKSGTNPKRPPCSVPAPELVAGRAERGSIERQQTLPSWIDLDLARNGQVFAVNHIVPIVISHGYGLLAILMIPDVADILIFTKNTDTRPKVTQRYLATAIQVVLWYQDYLNPSIPPNKNAWLTSLLKVKSLHLRATSAATKAVDNGQVLNNAEKLDKYFVDQKLWKDFAGDLEQSKLPTRKFSSKYVSFDSKKVPFNQFALILTQFAFVGYPVIFPKQVLIYDVTDDELTAFIHLWAVIGHALGIDDKYNICLRGSLQETKEFFLYIHHNYFVPAAFGLTKESKILVEAYLKGISELVPVLGSDSILLRFLRDIFQIPVPNLSASLHPLERTVHLGFDQWIHSSTNSFLARIVLNTGFNVFKEAAVLAHFGPFITNLAKANNVIYYP